LPNLILLDLLMPVMDGWGLISELKRDPGNPLANIPIIVVSAVGDRTHGIRSLVQDVIQKPIMLDKLIHAIQRFCPLP
jgi:CheY-like chemotaxis protein